MSSTAVSSPTMNDSNTARENYHFKLKVHKHFRRTKKARNLDYKNKKDWIKNLMVDNEGYEEVHRFLEFIGSIDSTCTFMKFNKVKEGILSKHTHVCHDGKTFESDDCQRFTNLDATEGSKNIRGNSARGRGLRVEMSQLNDFNENIPHDDLTANISKVSFIVSKIKNGIKFKINVGKEDEELVEYKPEQKYLVLMVMTNKVDLFIQQDCAIDDLNDSDRNAIMTEINKHPNADTHFFFQDLERFECYDNLCKDGKGPLLNALRFHTMGEGHNNLKMIISGKNILEGRPDGIIHKNNNLPYIKVKVTAFVANGNKNYFRFEFLEYAGGRTDELKKFETKPLYLYNPGKDIREEVFGLKKKSSAEMCKVVLKKWMAGSWSESHLEDDFEIEEDSKEGEYMLKVHRYYKEDPGFVILKNYLGENINADGIVIESNNCMCNDKFKNVGSTGDCCVPFNKDNRGCRDYKDREYAYKNQQHMHIIISEIKQGTETILDMRKIKCNSKLRKYSASSRAEQLIQFAANLLWREWLADRTPLEQEKPVEKTELEKAQEENKNLKKRNAQLKKKAKKADEEKTKAIKESNKKIKEVTKEKEIVNKKNKELTKTNSVLKKENTSVKKKADNMQKKVDQVVLTAAKIKNEANETMKQTEKMKEKLNVKNKELDTVMADLKQKEEELQKHKEANVDDDLLVNEEDKKIMTSFIYLLTDPSRPGWLKIGYTQCKTVEELLKQNRFGLVAFPLGLNKHLYEPIQSIYKYRFLAENLLHNRYTNYRVTLKANDGKTRYTEWFKMKEGDTIEDWKKDVMEFIENIRPLILPIESMISYGVVESKNGD